MTKDGKWWCVFCGSRANSDEHVIATRLFKRAGAVRFSVIPGVYTEGQEMRTRPKHTLESFTVGRACRECNHGWMNDLEDWFESRLGYLIEPKWPKLALTMIEELKPERNKLAHWMMKTAVTFSLSTMESEYRVVFPADVTLKIKEGILPKNVWVDLAYSDRKSVV